MRLVFAGTPEVALPSLDALVGSRHEVVAVVTRPDAPAGRGRSLRPSPVRERAESLGIPVLTPRTAKDPDFHDRLRELAPDACPVVAYGSILPPAALDIPRHGWINLHFSLLPAWRGAAPVQRALMAGDEITGASTFVIEEGLDTGPVLGTMTETIRPEDTAGTLLDRLAHAGAPLLVATMDALEDGSATPIVQPREGVSHAAKVEPSDAEIRWGTPAFAIDRLIRGTTPAPGAWTTFRGDRLKVGPVRVDTEVQLAAGAIRAGKNAVHVGTATQSVRLGEVQPHGKKVMAAADWARGVRIGEGEMLGG